MTRLKRQGIIIMSALGCISLLTACHPPTKQSPPLFQVLDKSKNGITFKKKLPPTQKFNVFKYMYYYNGAGVGAGDFNNDGKIDLFFAANQGDNKLYLNRANLRF